MTSTRDGVDPEHAPPPPVPVSGDSTAGVAVMAHLRRQTRALLEASPHVGEDPEAVHAARVATRRLRAGLRVYGDLLDDDVAPGLRAELSWYAGALSPVRDVDVFTLTVEGITQDHVADALLPWLRRRREVLVRDAIEALGSPRAHTLRAQLVEVARAPRFRAGAAGRAAPVLAPRVLRADDRATRAIEALTPDDPPEGWHAARITAKRARYAAEVGAPALGRPAAELAALWSRFTESLGDAQDAVIERELVLARVEDPGVPLTAGEAFACGSFVERSRERELSARQTASDAWQDCRDEHARLRKAVRKAGR